MNVRLDLLQLSTYVGNQLTDSYNSIFSLLQLQVTVHFIVYALILKDGRLSEYNSQNINSKNT